MICPTCGTPNLPGIDLCTWCAFDLSSVDRPTPTNPVEGSLMADTVGSVCQRHMVSVSIDATLGEAIAKMVGKSVGAVLVNNGNGELAGILTERDYLTRVAGAADFASRYVRDYMTANPETVALNDPLSFAIAKMDSGGYRHLPVMEKGIAVGVISVRDVLRHVLRLCEENG